MKTFKVTFFDRNLDIYEVKTFHNVSNQAALLSNIANIIVSLDLFEAVKAEAEGKDYTQAVNGLLPYDIAEARA